MSDLRDKLLKAGLVSAEQAKKVEEDARKKQAPPRPGPRQGGGGGGPRTAAREEASRESPVAPSKEESQRLLKLAQTGKVDGKTRGNRRWYFVSRQGAVPYLELSEEAVQGLEQGTMAIAESERGEAWLVSRECATRLREGDPAWIRSHLG
jgi:uncharacterized protein YaiL (DUF2058 family)